MIRQRYYPTDATSLARARTGSHTGLGASARIMRTPRARAFARPRVREKNFPFRSHLALISLIVKWLDDIRRSHYGHTLPRT